LFFPPAYMKHITYYEHLLKTYVQFPSLVTVD
jgi:hypothetical protein